MIYIIAALLSALSFALGVMTGQKAKASLKKSEKTKDTAEFKSQLTNFLNYDGTQQE